MLRRSVLAGLTAVFVFAVIAQLEVAKATELGGNLQGIPPPYLQVLKQILESAGIPQATVTSTERTPRKQAELMLEMILSEGVQAAKALYCPPGDAVIDKFDSTKGKEANLNVMEAELIQRLPEALELGCLNHVQNPYVFAVDVGASSVPQNKHGKLVDAGKKAVQDGNIVRFFYPPKDPKAFHFEFKK